VYRLDVITEAGYVLYTATFRAFSNASRWSCEQEVVVGGLPCWAFAPIERGLICAEWASFAKKVCSLCPIREVCLRHAFSAEDA
jgi:hypothetical protein